MPLTLHPSLHVHPGKWLKSEIIDAHGLSVSDAAEHLGVTHSALVRLLDGHDDVSAEMAVRFEKAFKLKADTLMRMQMAYDLAVARAN